MELGPQRKEERRIKGAGKVREEKGEGRKGGRKGRKRERRKLRLK